MELNKVKHAPCFKIADLESKNIILRAGKYLRNSEDHEQRQIYFTPDLTKKKNRGMRHLN